MFALLRERNFALLWFGGLISLMGDWILIAALPYYVYQQTGSTLATATMVAAELVPQMLFGSLAGVFVDRMDRRKIMIAASFCQGIIILALLLLRPGSAIWIVYVVTFIETTIALFFSPAENALLPLLVGKDQLLQANSMNGLNNNLARLIGPPIGGLILAAFGLSGIVIFDSVTFLIAGGMILLIQVSIQPIPQKPAGKPGLKTSWARFWQEWKEGLEIIRKYRTVSLLFLSIVLLNFGGIMIDPLAAPFYIQIVKVSPEVFGILLSVQAAGGIIGGLMAGKVGKRWTPVQVYSWGEMILGVLIIIHYNVISLPVIFTTSFLIGLPAVMGSAAINTLFQQNVPNSHLGRISGTIGTTMGFTSLFGVLGISGLLSQYIGIIPVLTIAGIISILAGLVIWVGLGEKRVLREESSE